MPAWEEVRIFVLGGFRDIKADGRASKRTLEHLVGDLREIGWDAYLSGDARSEELVGRRLDPLAMTEALEPLSDLAVFVATHVGAEGGWVAEVTHMQANHPEGAARRLVMLPDRYPLSSILDPNQGGVLARPPVLISWWHDRIDLADHVSAYAEYVASWGHLPRSPF